ncbi:hypothetical protein AOQ84DRAFT_430924 [Glonium stellatum]|uniref:DUF676 domain-containing protein n=1 Tax=Glonium stellatum TaxID=574774 RepID=A0A8E2JUT7_9PEZI|nr:hypothetical protein AOQ84DRAFT_430924 [Glonium stellatum]
MFSKLKRKAEETSRGRSSKRKSRNILFLHGLTGHRDKTWTAEKQSEPWPKTLLSTDIVDARIITYGYDADVVHWTKPAGQNTVREHARNLIGDFAHTRRKTQSTGRPIIFVAHSLGGLVCQDALLVCDRASEKYQRDILSSTRGVVFLGTPHAGSDFQKYASAVAKIVNLCLVRTNRNILEVLNGRSEVLANIKNDFFAMVRTRMENGLPTMRLHAFVEELPVTALGYRVVTPDSAMIPGYNSTTIYADHMGMTKFATKADKGYQRVSGILDGWVSELRVPEGTM